MSEKRVLLIESGHFIGGVIHSLFVDHEQLTVSEAAPKSVRELLKAIEEHQPEIIVLDDTVRMDYLNQLLRYMQSSSGIRVVVVKTNCNQVDIYEKQKVNVNQTEDFFAIL